MRQIKTTMFPSQISFEKLNSAVMSKDFFDIPSYLPELLGHLRLSDSP